ncbi:MAG: lamin tail domain-containing protein [Solirubrobacterales bacterium]
MTTKTGGTLEMDEVWSAAASPYELTGSLTIPDRCTLTLEPGVVVHLASGVSISVADGGRLLAEGTEAQEIRFAGVPDSGASWGGITINGSADSPETRMAYVSFVDNGKTCIKVSGGTLYLDHATFGTTTHQYVSLDDSSFLISHCYFPTATTSFELLHGSGGIKTGGRGIVRDSFFGSTVGYSDAMDFTGGNRDKDEPIIQYYNNVFAGSSDDILDLDGTDAWIEGNIFLHCHRNGAPDSSAAISGGNSGSSTSEITILGNLFFDCDNAATAKQGNFYTLINNTIVRTTKEGGSDFDSGVVCARDTTPSVTTFGKGFYLLRNIIVDAEQLVRNYDPAKTSVTMDDNILPMSWTGPGSGNFVADPMLTHIPEVSESQFTTWEQAQVMREWLSPQPGSPARGGSNGIDMGGVVPLGATIAGEPNGVTAQTVANLVVGVDCTGHGIPSGGFPLGSGFTHYRWRLDSGAWSEETPIALPIEITGLAQGLHCVEVVAKNDAGYYQNDPALSEGAGTTVSRTWTVDASYQRLAINEVLAVNTSAVEHEGTFPPMIELYYDGAVPYDLSGMELRSAAADSTPFVFPAGSTIAPGQYLVLYADADAATSGLHLGFGLDAEGDSLVLLDKAGTTVDSVEFGRQIADLSVGRVGHDCAWHLTDPSFGASNTARPMGDPARMKVNEWLAAEQTLAEGPFIELYNPNADPVDMEGMCLTDDSSPQLVENRIGRLNFMPAGGYATFLADGTLGSGHASFRLSLEGGMIRLFDRRAAEIDEIAYGPQMADVSEGRTPDGATRLDFFSLPTPGAANPGSNMVTTVQELVKEAADKRVLVPTGSIGDDWTGIVFDDSAWALCSGGPGGVGYENGSGYESLITLDVKDPMYGSGKNNTCYIRVPFTVDAETLVDAGGLTLKVRYDDGFVAYLNGVEVARRNFTGTPAWNSHADDSGESALEDFDEYIDISPFLVDLKDGANLLAIQGMNSGTSSSDFLISAAMDIIVEK